MEKNKAQYQTAQQTNLNFRSTLTTAPANISRRRSQLKLAQLRTGVSNSMGWYKAAASNQV